eukprot:GFYU01014914.1.p1 GENE.GFYU01014914.1~~GFYU01014914.1.p1  ORF type:complete len:330 (-),score=89.67 GFYU01014914.1:164-1153(-)
MLWRHIALLVVATQLACVWADDLYCGERNCYDILGLDITATTGQIRKTYRKLSLQYHPDKNKEEGAQDKFVEIARAYEILVDDVKRADYDDMLANPERMMHHYARYYRHQYMPKGDLRYVMGGLLFIITVAKYLYQHNRYNTVVGYAKRAPAFRQRVDKIVKEMKAEEPAFQANLKKMTKEDKEKLVDLEKQFVKEAEDFVATQVNLVGIAPPAIGDIFILQLIAIPWGILMFFFWHIRWFVLFTIMSKDYGDEEEEHLTRVALKLSHTRWLALEEEQRQKLLAWKVYTKEGLAGFQNEAKEKRGPMSAGEKRARRYWKKYTPDHGAGD